MRRMSSTVGALCLLLACRSALASGFFISQIGGPDAHPTEAAPTAVFWNPAALGGTGSLELQADLFSILRFASYARNIDYQWDPKQQLWNTVTGPERRTSLFNYVPLPFVGVSYRVNRRLVVGLAGYSPFGASSSWDAGGPQRFHSITGSNSALFISPSLSYRIVPGLHFGLTLSYVRSTLSSERKADFSDIVGGLPEDPSLAAKMKLSGFAGNAFSATFGMFIDLRRVRIGVSYQPPISVRDTGRIVLEPESDKLRDIIGSRPAEADAELRFTLPDNIKASMDYFATPKLRLRLYGEWVNWSRFDAMRITVHRRTLSLLPETIIDKQQFHDAFGLRLQAKYWLSDRLACFASIGYDSNAIPDETLSAVFMDADKITSAIGVDFTLARSFRGKLALQFTHFFPRSIESSTRVPSANGRYGAELAMIDLNISYVQP